MNTKQSISACPANHKNVEQADWLFRKRNTLRDHAILWALILSMSVHILVVMRLPNLLAQKTPTPVTLTIELAPPPKPKPDRVIVPKPKPMQPAPKSITQPKPLPIPKPRSVATYKTEPQSNNPAKPAIESEPQPTVIAAAPKAEPRPEVIAQPPEPEPPKLVSASQQDMDTARKVYSSLLANEIAKHKQYPRVAQLRGWQGVVKVDLQIDADGNVLASQIKESSGYEVLDKQALEMVKKVTHFPTPPDVLRGYSFNILVPVSFHLE